LTEARPAGFAAAGRLIPRPLLHLLHLQRPLIGKALADESLQLLAKLCRFLGVTHSGSLLQNQSLTGGG
jgi:hypothetical protein